MLPIGHQRCVDKSLWWSVQSSYPFQWNKYQVHFPENFYVLKLLMSYAKLTQLEIMLLKPFQSDLRNVRKKNRQNRKRGYYYTGLLVCILLDSSTIWSQCFLSLLPENVRKPYGFQMFSGGRERVNIHFLQSCCFKTQDAIAVILINYNNYHCRQELFTFWLF